MPIIDIAHDPEALTITIVAEFAAPVRRVWEAYLDPRQIERFWGPPGFPATFTRHDAVPGGLSTYYMTSPEGERHAGYWEWLSIEDGTAFEVLDGFAAPDGTPIREMPVSRMTMRFEATDTGTRTVTTSHYATLAELEQVLAMGVVDGITAAMSQIEATLADLEAFAADRATEAQLLDDTTVRISRVIRGTPGDVWRAHHEPELLRRWLLGPDGWTMPVCEVATEVGEEYRYEWADASGTQRFGFTGALLESQPPHRAVTSEAPIGIDGPPAINALTLTPQAGGTLLTLVITYPSREIRETALGSGMTDGMEASYSRLEAILR